MTARARRDLPRGTRIAAADVTDGESVVGARVVETIYAGEPVRAERIRHPAPPSPNRRAATEALRAVGGALLACAFCPVVTFAAVRALDFAAMSVRDDRWLGVGMLALVVVAVAATVGPLGALHGVALRRRARAAGVALNTRDVASVVWTSQAAFPLTVVAIFGILFSAGRGDEGVVVLLAPAVAAACAWLFAHTTTQRVETGGPWTRWRQWRERRVRHRPSLLQRAKDLLLHGVLCLLLGYGGSAALMGLCVVIMDMGRATGGPAMTPELFAVVLSSLQIGIQAAIALGETRAFHLYAAARPTED